MLRKIAFILGIIIVGSIIACSMGSSEVNDDPSTSTTSSTDASALKDVTVTTCKKDQFGGLDVLLSIKNNTKTVQSYLITVEALGADKVRIGEATAAVNTLRPAQVTNT